VRIKRIEHVAIAVHDLDGVRDMFAALGIACDYEETLAANGVRLAMLPVGESALELLQPTRPDTRLGERLERRGVGIDHICLEVADIEAALQELRGKGIGLLDQVPRIGHGGHRIAFLDPASTGSILVELVEMTGAQA